MYGYHGRSILWVTSELRFAKRVANGGLSSLLPVNLVSSSERGNHLNIYFLWQQLLGSVVVCLFVCAVLTEM